jgi:ribosomal protein S18 acetylase RimI-like enzyme
MNKLDEIIYNEDKRNLPNDQLIFLFRSAGWSDGNENQMMKDNFNKPFINSTLVVSAWDNNKLVGVIRVLSDKIIRSNIYDLVVLPEYQSQGIGRTLLKKCLDKFPDTAWVIETTKERQSFYEQFGFNENKNVLLC